MKDKVDVEIIPSPVKYEKDASREKGQANIIVPGEDGEDTITTIYTVNPNTGKITASEGQPVRTKEPTNTIVKVAAKDKVDVEIIPSPVKYEKDASREKGQANITVPGKDGSKTTTTTYTVNPNNGEVTPNVGEPVIVSPTTTIVKVAAKDEVVTSKDGNNIVKTATTYTVNPDNGNIIEHTTKETFKENGLKDKVDVEIIPSPVKYEKDASREKGQANITVPGKDGSKTTTTTYTVNPDNGEVIPNEGNPVIVNPTETIVKVAAKDKVVETPIEPAVVYEKDDTRDFGTPDERTEGEKGKTVTTTTYDVDPKDGHITEHVGNPVVTLAGKTIVKVGAKTKVEQSKDPEGRDVIDTTTYEVDQKTGKVTPTTVRTYGKTKEPKVELEQDPKTGDVTVTPKKPDGSTYPPGTTVEIPGKGDKPITVTIGEDGKGKVPNSELPEGKVPGTGKITESGKLAVEVPVENPAKVTIFENGVLPASIELPELMIEVRWIDEDGNALKPSVKTGNEKDAGHGSILGYEFVRTVIDENEPVITHIFRKVSSNTNTNTIPVVPVTPDANGNSGHDTPAPTTPIPDEVTPNATHEYTTDAIDNGVKSNDSRNVLPNTGTESNATLVSLGLLGILSGLGLALGKKKED